MEQAFPDSGWGEAGSDVCMGKEILHPEKPERDWHLFSSSCFLLSSQLVSSVCCFFLFSPSVIWQLTAWQEARFFCGASIKDLILQTNALLVWNIQHGYHEVLRIPKAFLKTSERSEVKDNGLCFSSAWVFNRSSNAHVIVFAALKGCCCFFVSWMKTTVVYFLISSPIMPFNWLVSLHGCTLPQSNPVTPRD